MTDTPLFEKTIRMLDGDMSWIVTGHRGYAALVTIKIETSVGFQQEIFLSPEDAREIANALMDAANKTEHTKP